MLLTQGVVVPFREQKSGMRLKIPLAFAVPAKIHQALVKDSSAGIFHIRHKTQSLTFQLLTSLKTFS